MADIEASLKSGRDGDAPPATMMNLTFMSDLTDDGYFMMYVRREVCRRYKEEHPGCLHLL
ncbi:hypothetical protein GN244_ATG09866 [Phytophthora infestans]|uniref:Uncharacterized protein n=1 Tax=Phytophthora infestans TaxID=4787 RepID=A0A833WUQ0_PHYIN|nr:hypothetical protein GN244_ATG09866 [Phytophthora infestans]KAF4145312.1 hypothetical protein GN958_ATG05501 [Phytophthora infestans]